MLGHSRSLRQNLVIQEETLDRGVLPLLLKSLGVDASCPDTPQQAAHLLAERRFDVVLTDINFSMLSGIELIDRVRRGKGPNAQTPIVVVTTDDSDETRRSAISVGADGYIIKPVYRGTLQQEIMNAVARRRLLCARGQR